MSKEQQPIDQEAIQSALAELAGLEKEFEKVDVDIRMFIPSPSHPQRAKGPDR